MSKRSERVSAMVGLAMCIVLTVGCPSSQTHSDAAAPKDGAAEAAAPDSVADTGGESGVCPAGQTRCGADCVDTQSAFLHCGACRNRCQGTHRCVAGQCVRAGICPSTCSFNRDCLLCSQEGDPTVWCCAGRNDAGIGLCLMSLTGRCPLPE